MDWQTFYVSQAMMVLAKHAGPDAVRIAAAELRQLAAVADDDSVARLYRGFADVWDAYVAETEAENR